MRSAFFPALSFIGQIAIFMILAGCESPPPNPLASSGADALTIDVPGGEDAMSLFPLNSRSITYEVKANAAKSQRRRTQLTEKDTGGGKDTWSFTFPAGGHQLADLGGIHTGAGIRLKPEKVLTTTGSVFVLGYLMPA